MSKQATFEVDELKQSAVTFQEHLREAELIEQFTAQTMLHAYDAGEEIVKLTGPDVGLLVNRMEATLQFSAGGRALTLLPLPGAAKDARLAKPRGRVCGQIVVFGHTADKEGGTLISCIRIYSDGLCSDGEIKWKVADGKGGIMPAISRLVQEDLFCVEVYWPPINELQPQMEQIPISKVQSAEVENPCIGFECSIAKKNGKKG